MSISAVSTYYYSRWLNKYGVVSFDNEDPELDSATKMHEVILHSSPLAINESVLIIL